MGTPGSSTKYIAGHRGSHINFRLGRPQGNSDNRGGNGGNCGSASTFGPGASSYGEIDRWMVGTIRVVNMANGTPFAQTPLRCVSFHKHSKQEAVNL
jgi:hypothetical protein